MTVFIYATGHTQQTVQLHIQQQSTKQPLAGAIITLMPGNKTALSDTNGIVVFNNLDAGKYVLTVKYIGMEAQELSLSVPVDKQPVQIFLTEAEEDENEVIVTATRLSRSINDIPTRVETISGEELSEKGNMKPGDIRMLLNESTGIQTQQTSATSYNSSIRIQGLDGRYTQVLRDGFPLYAGFSGGLSLMQVAPLDLKQIEVIKGSSSTLYGGGAIAGLVNLVSKIPVAKRELSFLANGTSAGGLDLSGFYSQRFKSTGITVFGSSNSGKAYDAAGIGLTAIPEFERYTINPRFFLYAGKTTANIGFSYITEKRLGGSMDFIEKNASGFFEKNNTGRFTTQLQLTHSINDHEQLNFKNSYSRFSRFIQIPVYTFDGLQQSSFSEASYSLKADKSSWIFGTNFITDVFRENKRNTDTARDYSYNTFGVFIQNVWSPGKQLIIETGLRADNVKQFGWELLPRVSIMYKVLPQVTARLGGGLGYKTPSVFNEESEKTQFRNILPIQENNTRNERSEGMNFDINYRTKINEVGLTINQLFFYTKLNKPLILASTGTKYTFINAPGHIDTKGLETNLRVTYRDLKLFIGYTYADVNTHYNDIVAWAPLSSRHRLNNVLIYEKEGKLKIGAEAYYFSKQLLNDGATGRAYWTFGLMAERTWKHFSLFINFENFTDVRQTKFDTIYSGPVNDPLFRDIYAPVDGFVVNGGIKIKI